MAVYNDNNIFLTVDGTDVSARWREFDMTFNSKDEDISAGSGVDWESHATGLWSITAKMTLVYDDTQAATDIAALYEADQVVTIIYGPENNTAGKPKHNGNFKINSIKGPSPSYDKKTVMLEFDLVSSGTPTTNLYAGGTW